MTAAAAVEPLTITEPGVYDGIPAADYHRDPVPGGSLSSTGARRLLPPSCPAKFAWEREHGRPEKRHFDLGHVAHREVLGDGELVTVVEAEDYRTAAARAARDEAYAAGKTPILRREYEETVLPMAAAIRAHPVAGKLFAAGTGRAEVSLFWTEGTGGDLVWRRSRPDWLPNAVPGRRLIVANYKTCASSEPDELSAAIGRHGYYMQAAWELDGVTALLELDRPPAYVFVCQEKDPPYVVTVCQLTDDALRRGRERNTRALNIYRRCRAAGRWGGYSDQVLALGLPGWLEYRLDQEVDDDD